jgi:sulfotransferase
MPVEKIFFQSSLPRSGSTLLNNILAQNPDIYATPTSGVIELLLNARNIYSNTTEFKAQDIKEMEKAFQGFCRAGLFGYFNALTDRKYVIDKSRGWSISYDFLNWITPNPKIIVMIRDLRGIVSSLEKKFRQNQHLDLGIQNWNELKNTTTSKRVDYWLNNVPLSTTLDILKDLFSRKLGKHCLFIKFETLNSFPDKVFQEVYNYLEIPYFQHDFDNVEQFTHEDDKLHGPLGDHTIRPKVLPVSEDWLEILGAEDSFRIVNQNQWFYDRFGYNK